MSFSLPNGSHGLCAHPHKVARAPLAGFIGPFFEKQQGTYRWQR